MSKFDRMLDYLFLRRNIVWKGDDGYVDGKLRFKLHHYRGEVWLVRDTQRAGTDSARTKKEARETARHRLNRRAWAQR